MLGLHHAHAQYHFPNQNFLLSTSNISSSIMIPDSTGLKIVLRVRNEIVNFNIMYKTLGDI